MAYKVGSFNVLNLKINTKATAEDKQFFKEKKCRKIAKIIRDNSIDIIALQEIQDSAATQLICNELGQHYDSCHCETIYQQLNSHGLRNCNNANFKSDYAYIWNRRTLQLCYEPDVYRKLEMRVQKEWDKFIDAIVDLLIEISRKLIQKEDSRALPDLPFNKGRTALKVALAQTLRPPFIACFRPASFWSGLTTELRFINTHAQWKKKIDSIPGSDMEIRKREMKFIQGELHTAINTFRTGDFRSVYTIIAGDFNMTLAPKDEISSIYTDPKFITEAEHHRMVTVQCEKTSLNKEHELSKNYDHFAFDQKRLGEYHITDAKRLDVPEEDFFIQHMNFLDESPDSENRPRPISDHYPIIMNLNI